MRNWPDRRSRPGLRWFSPTSGAARRTPAASEKKCVRCGRFRSAGPVPELRAVLGMTSAPPGLDCLPRADLRKVRGGQTGFSTGFLTGWPGSASLGCGWVVTPRPSPPPRRVPGPTERCRGGSCLGTRGRLHPPGDPAGLASCGILPVAVIHSKPGLRKSLIGLAFRPPACKKNRRVKAEGRGFRGRKPELVHPNPGPRRTSPPPTP